MQLNWNILSGIMRVWNTVLITANTKFQFTIRDSPTTEQLLNYLSHIHIQFNEKAKLIIEKTVARKICSKLSMLHIAVHNFYLRLCDGDVD